jgi:SagB-type dehydrogenase family enzyme
MDTIKLPTRDLNEKFSLSNALNKRTTCRKFQNKGISKKALSNILWAGYGINDKRYKLRRTVPSAGASYPIEIYLTVRKDGVHEVEPGIYRYNSFDHQLEKMSDSNIYEELIRATYNQYFLQDASINILIASKNERSTELYGDKGIPYIYMEAGGVSQNIHLEAVELDLGTAVIGAFDEAMVRNLFKIEGLMPIAIMPVGLPEDKSLNK